MRRNTATEDETSYDENGDTAMSLAPAQPGDDERPTSTVQDTGMTPAYADTTPRYSGTTADQPHPTFTPTPADEGDDFAQPMPTATSPADEPLAALPADELSTLTPAAAPPADFGADEPLLANTAGMRESWQKVQAEFVDDPQAAVMDAADLIEQTAQSLVDAIAQRQRQLRVLSDRGTANGNGARVGNAAGSDSAAASGVPDTEHLRLMMQRYRALFNQMCNS
jgi:hypothetical protein